MKEIVKYESEDGKVFDTKDECLKYEENDLKSAYDRIKHCFVEIGKGKMLGRDGDIAENFMYCMGVEYSDYSWLYRLEIRNSSELKDIKRVLREDSYYVSQELNIYNSVLNDREYDWGVSYGIDDIDVGIYYIASDNESYAILTDIPKVLAFVTREVNDFAYAESVPKRQ